MTALIRHRAESDRHVARATDLRPGGMNRLGHDLRAAGSDPLFAEMGPGPHIDGAAGNADINWACSWGPPILGHGNPRVVTAAQAAIVGRLSFGTPHRREVELAALVRERMPAVAMVRFVSSGTEAAMRAPRPVSAPVDREQFVAARLSGAACAP